MAAEAHAQLGSAQRAAGHAAAAGGITGFESSAWRAMAQSADAAAVQAAGDERAAHAHWLAAAKLYDRVTQPFWAARCHAKAAKTAPDADIRRSLQGRALAAFSKLGAHREIDRLTTAAPLDGPGNAQGTARP